MALYIEQTHNANHKTLTTAEAVELVQVRHELLTLLDCFLRLLNLMYRSGVLRPQSYAALDILLDVIANFRERKSDLEQRLSDTQLQ